MVEREDWKERLVPYKYIGDVFSQAFREAYQDRKNENNYGPDLPMLMQGWCINFAEAKQLTVILEYRPRPFSTTEYEIRAEYRDIKPELANMEDVNEIAKIMHIGNVIDSRTFLFESAHDALNPNAHDEIEEWAAAWAIELADKHMAETHPDFETARRRMTDAYSKLFELEHYLRLFVEQTLVNYHGSDWWNKAKISVEIKEDIAQKQTDTRGSWLDEYDESILRFIDFGQLRQIISANNPRFRHVYGNSTWFRQALSALEPFRNRIGHINVLSADDEHDFLRDSNRIIAAIRPHIQLEPTP